MPTKAEPPYSRATVVNAPRPAPQRCTKGVLLPKSKAASNASAPPLRAGRWANRSVTVSSLHGKTHGHGLAGARELGEVCAHVVVPMMAP